MSKNTILKNDVVYCPHCRAQQGEESVEDYIEYSADGKKAAAVYVCWCCNRFFKVVPIGNDKYEVHKIP